MTLFLLALACTAPVDSTDTEAATADTGHDHSTHVHTGLWPEDTGPVGSGEWLWECTPSWEPDSDLVGTWDPDLPSGKLYDLHDYTGCQALVTWTDEGRTDAYLVLFGANVVEDLNQRHGARPQATWLLSSGVDGEADGSSTDGALARGGMTGAFTSVAKNLVDPDPGGAFADSYLFLIERGGRSTETRRFAQGLDALPDGSPTDIALSGDGQWLVLASEATNLDDALEPGPGTQLFVQRNLEGAAPPQLLTLGADTSIAEPQLSHSGRFVVFSSAATTLVAGDTNATRDVFVLDRDPDGNGLFEQASRSVTLLSRGLEGEANGSSDQPRISADGRLVVFRSAASNLVAGDTNGQRDVFLRDRDPDEDGIFDEEGETSLERISIGPRGREIDGPSGHPGLSDDGRWVVFDSAGASQPAVDGATGQHVYLRDRDQGENVLISHDNLGSPALAGSHSPKVSPTGKTLVFLTASTTYDEQASTSDLHLGFAQNPLWTAPPAR